ncbi:hypothetical protein [Azospirillum sp.]
MLTRMLIHGLAAAAIIAVLAAAYQAGGLGLSGLPAFAADRTVAHDD